MKNIHLIQIGNKLQKRLIYKLVKRSIYYGTYFFSKKISNMKLSDAYSILNSYHANPKSTCLGKNITDNPHYDIQIIVPTYNNEIYLRDCIESIINQNTTYTWKLIIINDGSTDNSGKILEDYENKPNIEIIHTLNGGISKARNIGLATINANYVTFVDSDDQLPSNAIQSLLDCAIKNNADIVEGSYYRLYNHDLVKYRQIKDEQITDSSKLIGMAWGKIYKSSLFNNLVFPNNLWFEDTICAFMLYHNAKRIFTISDYVYIYRIVSNSISHSASKKKKSVDTIWVTELVLREYSKFNLPIDQSYHDTVMRQFILNEKRLNYFPSDVQEAAFVISTNLFENYCSNQSCSKKFYALNNFLLKRDFGHYKLFCNTH